MTGSSTQAIKTVLLPVSDLATAKAVSVAYWICTALTAFFIASGGLAYALAVPDVVEGVTQLGFPLYFIRLLGVWKVLGGLVILAPGFARLKEWAYAGAFFNMSGAAVSHVVIGDEAWHAYYTASLAIITLVSWALRPESRTLGAPLVRTNRLAIGRTRLAGAHARA